MKSRQWGYWIPWTAAALLVMAAIVYGLLPRPVNVELTTATRGPVTLSVEDDGETQIKERYLVTAPLDGNLSRIDLHAGDTVERDKTVVARLQPNLPQFLDARQRAEAQAKLDAALSARGRATAALDAALEQREMAEHDFDRARKLRETNAVSQADYDLAEHQLRTAEANRRAAEFALAVAGYEAEMAEATMKLFRETNDISDSITLKLVAPIDGRVLQVVREDAGPVTQGSGILTLGDPSQLELKIDVLSADAVSIAVGARVIVRDWGGPKPLLGRVRLIEPMAFTKISALGIEEKRVYVLADIETPLNERPGLGDGYRFEANIVIDETDPQSIKLHTAALFRFEDQWCVYKVVDARARLQSVSIGASNGRETQIIEGLQEGDRVILYPSSGLKNGSRIQAGSMQP